MAINTTNIKFNNTCNFATSYPRYGYIYQATGGGTTFSSNIANSSAYDYFPDSPSVNDAIYFGLQAYYKKTRTISKWRDLIFYVGTALNGTPTLVWEYYNGSSWTSDFHHSIYPNFTLARRNIGAQ